MDLSSPDPISPVEQVHPEVAPLRRPPPENPPWSLFDVLAIAVFAFGAVTIVLVLAVLTAHSLPRFHNMKTVDLAQTALILVPAQTVAYLLVIAFMVQIVRLRRRYDFLTAISWNAPRGQATLVALAVGVGLALFSAVFIGLLSKWMPKSVPIEKLFRDTSSAYILSLFGVVVAPFVEELFFRGFLYPALARHIGVGGSTALTAALFAIIHQGQLAHAWVPLTWLFVVGVVLTIVRARTKSVGTCVVIHIAYNATLLVVFFISSHGFRQLDHP